MNIVKCRQLAVQKHAPSFVSKCKVSHNILYYSSHANNAMDTIKGPVINTAAGMHNTRHLWATHQIDTTQKCKNMLSGTQTG